MTIRLRCAGCGRKLKVVDQALGKKVQCPVCGARFLGRIESSPPPVNETPLAQAQAVRPEAAAVEAASSEIPPLDALFAEMTTTPLTLEECGIPREVSLPVEPPSAPRPAGSPPLQLERDEPPTEIELGGIEPLEPEVVGEEMPIIEEAVEEEPPLLDTVEPAAEEGDSVEVDEEVIEEARAEEAEKKQPKQKKKRGWPFGRLAGLGLAMVLACVGLGFLVYRFYSDSIVDALLFGCLAGIALVMLLDVALRLPRRNRSV